MKIVIPGGSGQVGTVLARAFQEDGHDVVVLSRQDQPRPWRVIPWDGATLGGWAQELDGCDAVINLAGRSVNCRYTAANRTAILESRVLSTRAVGQAIAQARRPPRVWLQASTATIYSHRYDAPNDEASGRIGEGPDVPGAWTFSIDVARAWERALEEATVPQTRKVALRSAITLSPDRGGIFDTLLGLVRFGLGGTAGDGRQFISWVHDEDFVQAIRWLIDARGCRWRRQHRRAESAAERGVHARVARGVGRARWFARLGVDAGGWSGLHANRDRAHPEEPPRRAAPAPRGRLQYRLARCGGISAREPFADRALAPQRPYRGSEARRGLRGAKPAAAPTAGASQPRPLPRERSQPRPSAER